MLTDKVFERRHQYANPSDFLATGTTDDFFAPDVFASGSSLPHGKTIWGRK
jgi:hypothetical protein